jgi:hypothetical protein
VSDGIAKPTPSLPPESLSICVDADDLAVGADQRPAGVAVVDGGVGLDRAADRRARGRGDGAVQRGDDPGGERLGEAERAADRQHVGDPERQRRQLRRADPVTRTTAMSVAVSDPNPYPLLDTTRSTTPFEAFL